MLPDLFSWTEATREVKLAPRAHDEGSGSPRVSIDELVLVVIEAFPNGRHPQESPDPLTLRVVADSATGVDRDITERFEPDPSAPARWSLWLEPGDQLLAIGNTSLTISIGANGSDMRGEISTVLEVDVSHGIEIQPIWDQNCSGCHEGPNANKGLVLVAPESAPEALWRRIVNVFAAEPVITSSAPLLVRPHYPERSYLLHKLQGTHLEPGIGGEGERMPLGGPPFLDALTLHTVRSWIVQGAGK